MQNKIKVLIVDSHPIVRYGLVQLIDQEPNLVVYGEAEDAQQALKAIALRKPDIVVADIILNGSSGLDLVKDIKMSYPELLVLIFSSLDESLYAERVLRAGAMGYIMKHEAVDKFKTGIRQILNGEIYVSDKMSNRLLKSFINGRKDSIGNPITGLTDRELCVFHLIGQGYGTGQIAETLHLNIKTIESYRARIKSKLILKNARELLQHAIRWVQSENN